MQDLQVKLQKIKAEIARLEKLRHACEVLLAEDCSSHLGLDEERVLSAPQIVKKAAAAAPRSRRSTVDLLKEFLAKSKEGRRVGDIVHAFANCPEFSSTRPDTLIYSTLKRHDTIFVKTKDRLWKLRPGVRL